MSRKTATFSMSEDTYSRLKKHFPENTGSEANIIALLDALESEQADSEELKQLRAIKSEHSRFAAELTELQHAAQLQGERAKTNIAELEEQLSAYQAQIQALESRQPEVREVAVEVERQLQADEHILRIPALIYNLMQLTITRLNQRYNTNDTISDLLSKMFLRYTVERFTQWFYPWVLTDSDIEQQTGVTARDWKQFINGGK